jgi:hypothetical protein
MIVGSGATQTTVTGAGAPELDVTANQVILRNLRVDTTAGPALRTGNTDDQVQGSILTSGPNQPAMTATSTTAGHKTVTADSSVLSSSGSAAGLTLTTSGLASVGDLDFTGRHDTIIGYPHGVVADSSGAQSVTNPGIGNITATLTNSIVHAPSSTQSYSGAPVTNSGANTATVNLSNSDQSTLDASLFVNPAARDYHLRADAPVIGQGTGVAGDEFATDIDGVTLGASTTDLGAAQFQDQPPTIVLAIADRVRIAPGQTIRFAAAARAPTAAIGGTVTGFGWSFGDGSPAASSAAVPCCGDAAEWSTVITHTFTRPGRFEVRVLARDNVGGLGPASAPVTVNVVIPSQSGGGPGTGEQVTGPPSISITSPRPGGRAASTRRVRVHGRGRSVHFTRKRIGLVIAGAAVAPNGLISVRVALRPAQGRGCRWFDGRSSFRPGSCSSPRWFSATINDFAWSTSIPPGVRLPRDRYLVEAQAVDALGLTSGPPSSARRSAITFTLI